MLSHRLAANQLERVFETRLVNNAFLKTLNGVRGSTAVSTKCLPNVQLAKCTSNSGFSGTA